MNLNFLSVMQIWKRNFFIFRKVWLVSAFWILLEPLTYLLGLGWGLGSYVGHINGLSFVEFFFPGFLCLSSMIVAFFETTYPCLSKLSYQNIYPVIIFSPINPREIVWGEVLWGASKGTLSALGIALVGGAFGLIETWRIFPGFLIIFLNSFLFASFGIYITSLVKNFDQIIYSSSGIIVPLSLFSGTYFPIENFSANWKWAFFLSPLTHSVTALRSLLSDGFIPWIYIHILFLVILSGFFLSQASRRISRRLIT